MAGAQFEYDERGGTFFYFVISFYALVLIPITYYVLTKKSKKTKEDTDTNRCHCEGCQSKAIRCRSKKPWGNFRSRLSYALLAIGWIGFALLAYKVSHIEVDHEEYDPFKILEIDRDSTPSEVKKAYHGLSMKHHPDRGGDPVKFNEIAKAYQALTNEESKENFAKYGNPDGPGATTFGIALPKWLVSKEYGIWVLAAYGLVFMIVLPVGVGVWWYNSIKYSADQVLMDTTHLFGYMFHKTPQMILKRVIMVLGGSFEFSKMYNKDVVERPTDDREVPLLIKELTGLGEKNKEKPLCYPYSVKARALIHAHLSRLELPPDTLEGDKEFIIRKAPILLQEMIQVVSQLVMLASAGRVKSMPSIDTLENVMKLSAMIVQATWDKQSPLLQLPHFTEEMLRYCVNKRRRVKTCTDLGRLEEQERLSLFRNLNSAEYADIRNVLIGMPSVSMSIRVEVQGEDDKHTITAGSLVTVYVKLTRVPLLHTQSRNQKEEPEEEDSEGEDLDEEEEEENSVQNGGVEEKENVVKRKPWEKPGKKKGGGKGGKGGKKKPAPPQKKAPPPPPPKKTDEIEKINTPKGTPKADKESKGDPKPSTSKGRGKQDEGSDGDDSSFDSDSESEDVRDALTEQNRPETEDEDDLVFNDDLIKKERILETKSKITHPVHSPYFPEEKYEWWWVYMCDRRRKLLISGPVSVTTLVDEEEVELKFPAPHKPGTYSFQICLRSDSYMDADVTKDHKFEVHEAREVTSHPQWDFPSDDEDKKSESDHSDASEYTEDEEDED